MLSAAPVGIPQRSPIRWPPSENALKINLARDDESALRWRKSGMKKTTGSRARCASQVRLCGLCLEGQHPADANKVLKTRLLTLSLLVPLLPLDPAVAAEGAGSATYDASGAWVLHIQGPRLLAGECEVVEEDGYDEAVRIRQDRDRFVISTDGGPTERGTVEGRVYTHGADEQGTDLRGVHFTLRTKSVFSLTSPDSAVGETLLDLQFDDGTECLLNLNFEGERQQGDSRMPIATSPAA